MKTLLLGLTCLLTLSAFAEFVDIKGEDTPNDKGESITLHFDVEQALKDRTVNVILQRKSETEADFHKVKELPPGETNFVDMNDLKDKVNYLYYLDFLDQDGKSLFKSSYFGPFRSEAQWFNMSKLPTLIASLLTMAIILLFIRYARLGKNLYIRPLPGVKAIEDAVGRATEMGRPCIYSPGISTIDDIATLASVSILSKVAETIAEYQSKLIVPNADPIVYSVADEVIRGAYMKVGRPDAYRPDDTYFMTSRQFAYAAGMSGLMAREKPGANFFLGWFMAESLILAESGAMTGAIQIAGTDSISQIPFFIVACDYTLIGEELYAAGAVMGNNPQLLGGLKGQDYVKLLAMITIVVLFILNIAKVPGISTLLTGGN